MPLFKRKRRRADSGSSSSSSSSSSSGSSSSSPNESYSSSFSESASSDGGIFPCFVPNGPRPMLIPTPSPATLVSHLNAIAPPPLPSIPPPIQHPIPRGPRGVLDNPFAPVPNIRSVPLVDPFINPVPFDQLRSPAVLEKPVGEVVTETNVVDNTKVVKETITEQPMGNYTEKVTVREILHKPTTVTKTIEKKYL